MTSPSIIQTPGAIDEAASNFFHAFTLARQLSAQHQQLQMEQQKTQAQLAESGARTAEANSLAKQHEQELEESQNRVLGGRVAAGFAADPQFSDDAAWSQHLIQAQVPDEVKPYASAARQQTLKAAADTRKSIADAQEAEVKARAAQNKDRNDKIVGDLISTYSGHLDRVENVQNLMERAVAKTGDPSIVNQLDPFMKNLKGDWQKVVGTDGRVSFVEPESGRVRQTNLREAVRGSGGLGAGVTAQVLQQSFQQENESLAEMERLESVDNQASKVPPLAALAARARGTGPMALLQGLASPAAQASMTPNQQQFWSAANRWAATHVSNMPKSRGSTTMMDKLLSGWVPVSGQADETRAATRKARLNLMRQNARVIQDPVNADLTTIPGYKDLLVQQAKDQLSDSAAVSGPGAFLQ